MSGGEYGYVLAAVECGTPDAGYLVRTTDGRVFANPHVMAGSGFILQQDDTVVLAVRDGRAFVLGRHR